VDVEKTTPLHHRLFELSARESNPVLALRIVSQKCGYMPVNKG
jgi:hypothetical protein